MIRQFNYIRTTNERQQSFGANHTSHEPTPEQLHDDGRADGIPVRTLDDVKAQDRARLAEIEKFGQGSKRLTYANGQKPKYGVRVNGSKPIPAKAVAEMFGINVASVYDALRGCAMKRLKGVRLEKVTLAA